MRAVLQTTYGGDSGVWQLGQIATPTPRAGEVLVRIEAAALDRGTWHLMTGVPYAARVAFGLRRPRNPVPGIDLAGRVVAVGSAVEQFSPGDEVFGVGSGSCAEFAVAKAEKLAPRPPVWSAAVAAAVPVSGATAWQAVHSSGQVSSGQRVLVLGASGGVGSFAVQLARAAGATVTGVCSAAKTDFVRGLGAERVLAYERDDLADPEPFDVVIDIGGARPIRDLRRLTAPAGTIVLVGAEGGGRLLGGVGRSVGGAALSPFVRQRIVMLASRVGGRELRQLAAVGEAGGLVPAVDRTFTLDEAGAAMDYLAAGGVRGKVVIRVRRGDAG
jgi:NADPH:quinone reductase-like Zn-dependent oxidoreductase